MADQQCIKQKKYWFIEDKMHVYVTLKWETFIDEERCETCFIVNITKTLNTLKSVSMAVHQIAIYVHKIKSDTTLSYLKKYCKPLSLISVIIVKERSIFVNTLNCHQTVCTIYNCYMCATL